MITVGIVTIVLVVRITVTVVRGPNSHFKLLKLRAKRGALP